MIKLKHYGYWSLILLALCFGFSPNHVSAAAYERGYEIVPFWQELTSIVTSLTAERNQLECECVILANEMDCPIIGTMSLEKRNNGNWQRVIAWGIRDTGSADLLRTYHGVSGTDYRLKIYIKVGRERVIEYSDVCTVE